MWNLCCSERTKPERRQNNGFASLRLHGTSESKRTDADRCNEAVLEQDLGALVGLLSSQEPIDRLPAHTHPWAEDPKTVGALAAAQIAILASTGDEAQDQSMKEAILQAGAIPLIVDMLRSDQSDRVQTAVVGLKFLLDDCAACAVDAFEHGALSLLLQQLNSPIGGMRAAAATALRNMCLARDEYRSEFSKLGGIRRLVQQLCPPPDPAMNQADIQLEAILNLQDVIEDLAGAVIEQYALQALDAGAEEKLQSLTQSTDEEVQTTAAEVLAKLSSVMSLWASQR